MTSRSMSKKQSAPVVVTAVDKNDSWNVSITLEDDDDGICGGDEDPVGHDYDETITQAITTKSIKKTAKIQRKTIVQVARAGQLAELQQLLNEMDAVDRARSISKHDAKNYSALHYAAHRDNLAMVKLLVKHGADVDDVGEADRRPLHMAVGAKKDQAKADAAMKMSKLPVILENHGDDVVKVLLSKGANVNAEDSRGRTPLHIATLQGNTEAVEQLLSKSDIELDKAGHLKKTPLLLACHYGKIDIAIRLIDKGADLTVYDNNYDTPLHIAFRERHKKIARRIIERAKKSDNLNMLKGILIKRNGNRFAPIQLAVREGFKELVKISIDHVLNADQTDGKDEKDGESHDEEDVVNYGEENNDTPLHEASSAGHLEIVKLLLEKGAKINVQNGFKETPLHHACQWNRPIVAGYLFEK